MTSEEKVLEELKEKINQLFIKIQELKVTEQERASFEKDKTDYIALIHDYKRHKAAFEEREKQWNLQHQ
jgi:hypothetical protein